MAETDYVHLTDHELTTLFQRLDPETTRKAFPKLTETQIQVVTGVFQPQLDTEWQDKLRIAFKSLNHREKIQAFGKSLTLRQIKNLIKYYGRDDDIRKEKMLILLMATKPACFEDLMRSASEEQISIMQSLADGEPIHYHLTLLLHTLTTKAERLGLIRNEIVFDIQKLDVSKLSQPKLEAMLRKIDDLVKRFERTIKTSNNALALAWNGGYEELIEKLTTHKESWISYLDTEVGQPQQNKTAPKGLYLTLREKLNSVYSKKINDKQSVNLDNEDHASEGLAALSIWSLEDYIQVGLLPGLDKNKLKHHLESLPKKERDSFRHQLQKHVEKNLLKINLETLEDLKSYEIYSIPTLEDYISTHGKLLNPVSLTPAQS